ncbi:SH3 domain-containing protein [Lentilactobacillus kosonis]|uniref:Phage protein n=1 Tax=Lentilactobacillus kosonis TaxID=2810561 RepID=A0A401FQ53_9LACO|nr:SH3 domain-containing protein [Lentilactobacillus kosonis]GAY74361.1 phage protein [Lentilactobacillus kosonis]
MTDDINQVKKTYFADDVYFQPDTPASPSDGSIWFKTSAKSNWLNWRNDDNDSAPDPSEETHTEVIDVQVPNDGIIANASGSFTWNGQQPIATSPSLAAHVSAYTYNGLSATYKGKTIADGLLWVFYTNYNGSTSYVPVKDLKSGKRFGTDSNAGSDPAAYHTEQQTITVGGNTKDVTHTETVDRTGQEWNISGKFYKSSGSTGIYTAPHQANKSYNISATSGNPLYYYGKIYSDSWLWIVISSGGSTVYAPAYNWNGGDDLSSISALGVDTNTAGNLPARETKIVHETVTVPDTRADNDTQLEIDTSDVSAVSEYKDGSWSDIPYQKQVIGASLMGASIDSPLISLGNDGALWSSYSYSQLPTWFKPIQSIGTIAMAKGELVVTGQTKHYENGQWGYYDTDQTFTTADDTNYTTTVINAGGIKNEIQTSDRNNLVARSFLDGNGLTLTNGERGNITNNISNKQFLSNTIYNTTTGDGANVNISANGVVQRSTSATKYKLDITNYEESLKKGYDLIQKINPKMWFDKGQVEDYARSLTDGQTPNPDDNLNRIHGLIAEDLENAGIDEFITRGADGEIEGIDYAKLWTLLIPVCKDLDSRLKKLEDKSKPE